MEGSEVLYARPRAALTSACAYTAAIGRLLIIVYVRDDGKDTMATSRHRLAPCTYFGMGMFYTPRVRGLNAVTRTDQNATFPCTFGLPRTLPKIISHLVLLFLLPRAKEFVGRNDCNFDASNGRKVRQIEFDLRDPESFQR